MSRDDMNEIIYGFGGFDDNKWCEAEDIDMNDLDELMERYSYDDAYSYDD